MALSPVKNRASGLVVFEVKGANPNGNIDNNEPRQNNNRLGMMTPMCFKRRLRDQLVDHQAPSTKEIIAKLKLDLDLNRFHIFESLSRGMDIDMTAENAPKKAIDKFFELLTTEGEEAIISRCWDIRTFGCTSLRTSEKKPKKKEKETEEEKEPEITNKYIKTGCVTFSPLYSVAPIQISLQTITKKYTMRDDLLSKGQTGDMAPDGLKFVEHGIYVGRFGINPNLARHTKTTTQDIDVLKELMKHVFTSSESSCRPAGSMNMLHVWYAEHENALGSFNECLFWDALTPKFKKAGSNEPSQSINDYEFPSKFDGVKIVDLVK